jgi:hypothetical protein
VDLYFLDGHCGSIAAYCCDLRPATFLALWTNCSDPCLIRLVWLASVGHFLCGCVRSIGHFPCGCMNWVPHCAGMFTSWLTTRMADVFAGFAPVSGTNPRDFYPPETGGNIVGAPARELSVLWIHGRRDSEVPMDGAYAFVGVRRRS